MELRATVILPLVSTLKPNSTKDIQLEAWLHKALIRFIKSRGVLVQYFDYCVVQQLVNHLIQRASQSVDVRTHSASGKWKVCWESEWTHRFSSSSSPALATPSHFLSLTPANSHSSEEGFTNWGGLTGKNKHTFHREHSYLHTGPQPF